MRNDMTTSFLPSEEWIAAWAKSANAKLNTAPPLPPLKPEELAVQKEVAERLERWQASEPKPTKSRPSSPKRRKPAP